MDMLIGGNWISKAEQLEVRSPYDDSIVETVPDGTAEDVTSAIDAAEEGAAEMANMPAHERSDLLRKTSEILEDSQDEIANLLAREVGKTIDEAHGEAERPPAIFDLCADAAKQITGDVIPFDAAAGAEDRRGYCMRVPCGIVSAISPFNFPVALSAHKVAPALAAGNSVVLKPASQTPLGVLAMAKAMVEAGFPPGAINVVTAAGSNAQPMATDPRVRVLSFTGSAEVGEKLSRQAGIKYLHLELGSSSAVTIMQDADWQQTIDDLVADAFGVAGQVCISVQKVLIDHAIYDEFVDEYVAAANELTVGDPLDEDTDVGPMISEDAAARAETWLNEATDAGAEILCGGDRDGTLFQPTVIVNAPWTAKLACEEAFAPVVLLYPVEDVDEAVQFTNIPNYGLQAAIYTNEIDTAFRFAEGVDVGGVNVNETCWWRVDFQPYGGRKRSGVGREGIEYAIEEMTEMKTIAFKL